jgi:hypothetical protein
MGGGTGSMAYPGAGVPVSTGTAWGTSLTGDANTLFGYNGAGTLGFYTTHTHSGSDAQFYDATDLTKKVKIDSSGMAANKTATIKPVGTRDVIFTNTHEVDGHATVGLGEIDVSGTIINSYGRSGAATLTLPAAASGYSFVAVVGKQDNSAWKILISGSDRIYADVGAGLVTGKTYVQETNQVVGSMISCYTFQTGASAWSWMCNAKVGTGWGTWVTD